jgi:hypothetical protein
MRLLSLESLVKCQSQPAAYGCDYLTLSLTPTCTRHTNYVCTPVTELQIASNFRRKGRRGEKHNFYQKPHSVTGSTLYRFDNRVLHSDTISFFWTLSIGHTIKKHFGSRQCFHLQVLRQTYQVSCSESAHSNWPTLHVHCNT